jgi:putative PIN family toxin of toxin-antitoxin system
MPPLRLVLDTNVLVSAALNPDGLQRKTLTIALSTSAILFVSRPILTEYAGVLARSHLRIRRGIQLQLMQLIKNQSRMLKPAISLKICPDPSDNRFLECAQAARADYLITGNLKHYPRDWKQTRIITSREFINLIEPNLPTCRPRRTLLAKISTCNSTP